MFLGNLFFASFNAWQYVQRTEDKNRLIIFFYLLVTMVCLSHVYFCTFLAIQPQNDPMIFGRDYCNSYIPFYEVCEWIGSCSMLALNWLVCATIFKLAISIRLILGLVESDKASKYRCTMYIFASVMTCIQLVMIALIPLISPKKDLKWTVASYIFLFSYLTLAITYFLAIRFLRNTLSRLKDFANFQNQFKDVMCQFLFFGFAMFTKISLNVAYLLIYKFKPEVNNFVFTVLAISSHFVVDILPVTYMLYSHWKARRQNIQETASSTESGPCSSKANNTQAILRTILEPEDDELSRQTTQVFLDD